MKGNLGTVGIVELGRRDGPFPVLNYRYVADKHYAVRIENERDSWSIELSLRSLPKPIVKSSMGTLFADHVEEPKVFVANAHGRTVAWMELGLQKWNNRMRVWHLLVTEGYRSKGIGSQLIGRAKEIAKEMGARMLILETQSCNVSAISFYLKHGFELVGVDSAAYSNDDIEKGEVRLEFGWRI